jgi:DNA-binding MarR family transcriptional regulator
LPQRKAGKEQGAMPVDIVHMHDYVGGMKDDFDLCLVLNTRMAARAVTRRADRKLRGHGVTASQFNILAALSVHGGRTITETAEALAMDRTTLSRNLALLERKGLVVSAPSGRGNSRLGALTEAGQAMLETIVPEWRRSQAELRQSLTNPDFTTVLAGLRHLSAL